METPKNTRVIFTLPGESTIVDVIDNILKNNGLEESDEEYFDKEIQNKEPLALIVRDAVLTIVQKKIPKERLVELLQKHLETSKETAEKIVNDINQKIIPFAKVINTTKTQEELLQKLKLDKNIFKPEIKEDKPPMPYLKTAPIINVEKNAENMEKEGKNIMTQEKNKFPEKTEVNKELPIKNTKSDTYREPIE